MRVHCLLLVCALAACGVPEPDDGLPTTRRRVLLLTVDTLRADHVGARAMPLAPTPFLDELLAQGFLFRRAVVPVPRTTPTLASVLAGAYPHTTGVHTLTDPLSREVAPSDLSD